MFQSRFQGFRRAGVSAISALVYGICYLLIPLAVVSLAAELTPVIGFLIVVPTIPVMWFLPGITALVMAVVLWYVTGDQDAVNRGWAFGVLLGSGTLSAVWFLPFWRESLPSAAALVLPFRIPGLLDNPWLIGLSWLACVPIMVYANVATALGNADTEQADGEQTTETGMRSSTRSAVAMSSHSNNGDNNTSTTSAQRSPDLTYRWDTAPDVGFVDVGGLEELKSEIERSVLRPLVSTDAAYERFNISPPNGILFYGPPGTGKTHFARAIAGELGHPYLELSAGDLKSQWINESTEKVTQLFREGEQFERCVIFIDEIDALLAERGNDLHQEHAQVVNEFLAQLDAEDPNFLLIAATNQIERLDEAATRRGRFDQQYEIGFPDREAREAIFRVRLQDMPTELDEEDYQQLAARSEGLSGAEIVGIIEDAAVHAAEREAKAIERSDIYVSTD